MSSRLAPSLPLILFTFSFVAALSPFAAAQTRGSSGPRYVNPANDARNAAVLGKGNNIDTLIVHPSSAEDEARVEFTVRFVVRDNVTGKVGSVTAPLTVN